MDDKQLQKVVEAVEEAIQEKVNHKIDRLDRKFDKHSEEMKPLLETLRFLQSAQRFCKWIGFPFIALLTLVYLWIKKI